MTSSIETFQTSGFGVQIFNTLESEEGLDLLSAAGVRWVRIWLSWDTIESENTTPEYYDWTELDSTVDRLKGKGFNILFTLAYQPDWAAEYPMGPVYDVDDLIEFLGAVVERYDGDGVDDADGSPVVRYFEIYNEPDNGNTFFAMTGGGYWGNNGAGYAELLWQLYPVLKAANQDAQLVFGGVALEWFDSDDGWFDKEFLDDVLTACRGKSCFDIMNFHYYPGFRSKWEVYGRDIIGKATYVRKKLEEYDFRGVPIMCTETGWASGMGWGALGSPQLQNQYIAKVYVRGMEAGLAATFWYKDDDVNDTWNGYGLLNESYLPKSSYLVYKTLTRMLDGLNYQRSLTIEETGSAQIEGYIFRTGSRQLILVWKDDMDFMTSQSQNVGDDKLSLTINASSLHIVDKIGNELWIFDGDDGEDDKLITVNVSESPLYIEYYP